MPTQTIPVDPNVQAIIDAEARGFKAAQDAGSTLLPAAPRGDSVPPVPPMLQPWFRPNGPAEQQQAPQRQPRPTRPPIPLLVAPKREPKVGDRVLYWIANPGSDVGAVLVPADVHGMGQPVHEDGKTFDTVNLNVHEPGFLTWAGSIPYSIKPRVGCWCYPSDVK